MLQASVSGERSDRVQSWATVQWRQSAATSAVKVWPYEIAARAIGFAR
jgi:hypothetical protein